MRMCLVALASASTFLTMAPAAARNIVLTNDDGLTSNVVALYQTLKAAGHDVIVSVPCANQSGMGAAAYFGKPLAPLATSCRNGAATAGDPGAGPITRADIPAADFYYTNGTPVMAMLYGIDVAGKKRWNKAPDLVLSGPNEGQNVGGIILSSGTVGNAQYAALRGIPAIAVSAGANSTGDEKLANPLSRLVAQRTAELVTRLEEQARDKPLLPAGLALNVNFPDNLGGAVWRQARIGTYNAYSISFSDNMARDASPTMQAMARQHGLSLAEFPGVVLEMNALPVEAGQQDDESIVYRTAIAVSPMRAGYDNAAGDSTSNRSFLRDLFRRLKPAD